MQFKSAFAFKYALQLNDISRTNGSAEPSRTLFLLSSDETLENYSFKIHTTENKKKEAIPLYFSGSTLRSFNLEEGQKVLNANNTTIFFNAYTSLSTVINMYCRSRLSWRRFISSRAGTFYIYILSIISQPKSFHIHPHYIALSS